MSPVRVEVQDKDGHWIFGSYAYNARELAELIHVIFKDSKVRVFERGSLTVEKDGEKVTDYTVN